MHCVISNISSMHKKIHSYIGCNDLFIHCVILCVYSNRLREKIHSHIGSNCYAFLLLYTCKAAVASWENASGKILWCRWPAHTYNLLCKIIWFPGQNPYRHKLLTWLALLYILQALLYILLPCINYVIKMVGYTFGSCVSIFGGVSANF